VRVNARRDTNPDEHRSHHHADQGEGAKHRKD
jgi:hypothetical protein